MNSSDEKKFAWLSDNESDTEISEEELSEDESEDESKSKTEGNSEESIEATNLLLDFFIMSHVESKIIEELIYLINKDTTEGEERYESN